MMEEEVLLRVPWVQRRRRAAQMAASQHDANPASGSGSCAAAVGGRKGCLSISDAVFDSISSTKPKGLERCWAVLWLVPVIENH